MELFLSVFLGILAGGLVGAISLFILDIFNKFIRRKDVIISILLELETNLAINDLLKTRMEESYDNFDSLIEFSKIDSYFKYNSNALNNYFNDLHLILDNNLIKKVIHIYAMSDFFILNFKSETFSFSKKNIYDLGKDKIEYRKFLDKYNVLLKKIEDVKYDDIKDEDIKTKAPILKKLKYTLEKIITNDEALVKIPINILKSWLKKYDEDAKILITELKKVINLKFFLYNKLLYRYYFRKKF